MITVFSSGWELILKQTFKIQSESNPGQTRTLWTFPLLFLHHHERVIFFSLIAPNLLSPPSHFLVDQSGLINLTGLKGWYGDLREGCNTEAIFWNRGGGGNSKEGSGVVTEAVRMEKRCIWLFAKQISPSLVHCSLFMNHQRFVSSLTSQSVDCNYHIHGTGHTAL